ncbi:DMT family transporter [Pseudotabrizicola sp. L79]|uniref:DMT family transporter n=1 Tax=Pseudotabrizicola sp. L79 TaxID=3118402 RepID=UPI002F95D536
MTLTQPQRGHLAMLGFSALVAGSFSLGSVAAPFVDAAALTTLRFLIAALLVGIAAGLSGGLTRRMWAAPWRYGVLGALMAAYFVLMFEGLKTAPAVATAAVFTLTPVMSAGFGWVLLRQGLTLRMAVALALGASGALWVIFRGDWAALTGFQLGRGEAIYFWGCVAHALYTPMVRRLNRGESAIAFTFGTMLAGFGLLTLWAGPAVLATDWAALPAIVWWTLAYIAVVASAITFVLVQYASLRLPASKVMAYTYLTPSWVILWELALGREAPPLVVSAGLGLTVVALWLLLQEPRPR